MSRFSIKEFYNTDRTQYGIPSKGEHRIVATFAAVAISLGLGTAYLGEQLRENKKANTVGQSQQVSPN